MLFKIATQESVENKRYQHLNFVRLRREPPRNRKHCIGGNRKVVIPESELIISRPDLKA